MATGTVKGGYWAQYGGGSVTLGKNPQRRHIARWLDLNGFRSLKELMLTLNGTAAGQAASATHPRVSATHQATGDQSQGGKRTITTVTDVGRNTTAADKSDIDATILAYPLQPTTYPANGDGNSRGLAGG